jgi:hypothetical protein
MNDRKGEAPPPEGQGHGLTDRIEALVGRLREADLAALDALAEDDRSFGERTLRRAPGG